MEYIIKIARICGIVLLVAVLVFVGFFMFIMFGTNTYQTDDIAYYQALCGEAEGPNTLAILGQQIDIPDSPYDLPYLSDLQPYEDYRFRYIARRESIFESHAYTLVVEYSAEYAGRKADLEEKYVWLSDPIPGETDGVSPSFELDGFQFRAVEGGWYPKEMLFVGTSDERNEIAYIYIYDFDLDYVSPTAKEFVRMEAGWIGY